MLGKYFLKQKGIRRALDTFSKANASSQDSPSKETPFQQLKAERKDWLYKKADQSVVKSLQAYWLDSIDASAGGSGFVAPDEVMQKLSSIEAHELPDYGHHLPSETLVKDFNRYAIESGMLPKGAKLSSDPHEAPQDSLSALAAYGTHNLFQMGIKQTIRNPGDMIIVTEPTYGLLLDVIVDSKGKIVTLPLTRNYGHKPNPQQLKACIKQNNQAAFREWESACREKLDTFYNLISQNRAINISVTKFKIDEAFQLLKKQPFDESALQQLNCDMKSCLPAHLACIKESLMLAPCPRVRGYFNINPHTPLGTVLTQDEVDALAVICQKEALTVIDDLTHWHVRLSDQKPGSFANTPQAKSGLSVLSLVSISKDFGLAAVRAGMAFGPSVMIKKMGKMLFKDLCLISHYSLEALSAVFNLPLKKRTEYLSDINAKYQFRKQLVIACVKGIDAVKDKDVQARILDKIKQMPLKQAFRDSAIAGIPGLDFVVDPKGGYFCSLDFSNYIGKYLGQKAMVSSMDFRNAFLYLTDLEILPGELNYQFDFPNARFCLTMDNEEIVEAMLRMKHVLSLLTEAPLAKYKKGDKSAHNESLSKEKPSRRGNKRQETTKPSKLEDGSAILTLYNHRSEQKGKRPQDRQRRSSEATAGKIKVLPYRRNRGKKPRRMGETA